jgi:hypothetical protein
MRYVPYALNILILVPVCLSLFLGGGTNAVFGPHFADSPVLRNLVGALWLGVLICSCLALVSPQAFWPLLLFQVIYKALFLFIFVAPLLLRGETHQIPVGVAVTFAIIVVSWPYFIHEALKG